MNARTDALSDSRENRRLKHVHSPLITSADEVNALVHKAEVRLERGLK